MVYKWYFPFPIFIYFPSLIISISTFTALNNCEIFFAIPFRINSRFLRWLTRPFMTWPESLSSFTSIMYYCSILFQCHILARELVFWCHALIHLQLCTAVFLYHFSSKIPTLPPHSNFHFFFMFSLAICPWMHTVKFKYILSRFMGKVRGTC